MTNDVQFETSEESSVEAQELIELIEWYPRPEVEPVGKKADWEIWGDTVSAYYDISMAITTDGILWGWGDNSWYQCATGYNEPQPKPVEILTDVATVHTAGNHISALRTDGSMWLWGNNYMGQIGNNSKELAEIYPVKALENVANICKTYNTVFAIDNEKQLWAWGDSRYGQALIKSDPDLWVWQLRTWVEEDWSNYNDPILKHPELAGRRTPIKILDNIVYAEEETHAMALSENGDLWSWGSNDEGAVGNSSYDRVVYSPVKIMENVIWINKDILTSYIITGDNKLWICGTHVSGTPETGEKFEELRTPYHFMDNVVAADYGWGYEIALKDDGSLWAWGRNEYGQMGNNETEHAYEPLLVMNDVKSVYIEISSCYALKEDSTLWVWGENTYGQLGVGITAEQHRPVKIMDDVHSVYPTWHHALFLKNDGTLWACGNNEYGQLGDGTFENRYEPVLILENVKLPDKLTE